jgi:hypothetical protein
MDYLGKANTKLKAAKKAIKSSENDKAWSLLHEVADIYALHINTYNSNTVDLNWAIGLLNSVSEYKAYILSKEGKHKDALYHATLKAATESRPIKKYKEKMMVYFRKAKLTIDEEEFLKVFESAAIHKDPIKLKEEFKVVL